MGWFGVGLFDSVMFCQVVARTEQLNILGNE
jgi:hypothetical protein